MAAASASVSSASAGTSFAEACEQAVEEGLLVQPPVQAFGVESDDGGASSAEPADVPAHHALRWWRPRKAVVFSALGTALVLGCMAVGAGVWRRPQGPQTGDVDAEVELGAFGSMLSIMGSMADGVHQASALTDSVRESYHSLQDITNQLNTSAGDVGDAGGSLWDAFAHNAEKRKEMIAKFKAMNQTQKDKIKKKLFKRFNITSLKQLRPHVDMHDGNFCAGDEEEFGGLCYKKCGLLTAGVYPYRVSAWECCKHPGACTEDYRISFKICGGFGVSGNEVGGGCPHSRGACLKNEEIWGNLCYKRCAMMTYEVLTVRAGPATCCKPGDRSFLDFLDISECNTQSSYYQGGGADDDDHHTPSTPHLPMTSFTEA